MRAPTPELGDDEREPELYDVEVDRKGRIVIPVAIRQRLGLGEGEKLVLGLEPDNTLTLVSRLEIGRRTAGIFAHIAPGISLADELVADRREEARREDAE